MPAPPGTGGEERDDLLAVYGAREFDAVQQAAQTVLQHHINDANTSTTIDDRREPLAQAARARQLRQLANVFPDYDY